MMYGAVAELVQEKYGGDFEFDFDVVSVDTTAQCVIKSDPDRPFLLLANLSANIIYLGYDSQVSATRGLFLAANGGNYIATVDDDLLIPSLDHFAVAAGAGSNLLVVWVRRFTVADQGGPANAA